MIGKTSIIKSAGKTFPKTNFSILTKEERQMIKEMGKRFQSIPQSSGDIYIGKAKSAARKVGKNIKEMFGRFFNNAIDNYVGTVEGFRVFYRMK